MNRPILLGSMLSLAACHSQSTHAIAESPAAADRAMATIDAASLAGSIRLLSSDLFEGRGPGSRGDELARAYIQSEFERSGLEPAAADGSWEQKVPILGITSKVTQPLMVTNRLGDSAVLHFDAPTDYTAVAGSDSAEADWKDAGLVFVGYGIHAPEQDWDDYGDVDLTGKVLLVMNNDPSTDPALFAGKTRLYYGRWSYKFEEAARRRRRDRDPHDAIGWLPVPGHPTEPRPRELLAAVRQVTADAADPLVVQRRSRPQDVRARRPGPRRTARQGRAT